MDKRITVVLADANEEFRTALKQALEATGEFDVVGCAADGLAAAQDIAERKPQLLVMDLLLPGLDGFGVLEQAAIKVPVLLGHGKLDARVDVQHSRALAKAMRKAGTPVDVVEYQNEGHGLAIDAHREDFYARLLAFLKDNTR